MKAKPEWFLARNPLGKVPTLQKGSEILYESLVTCDYLDAVHPEPRLLASEPLQRAKDSMLVECFNKVVFPMYRFRSAKDDAELRAVEEDFKAGLRLAEVDLEARGTKFFGGNDRPMMVDYMIWPWLERIPSLNRVVPGDRVTVSESTFPKLVRNCKKIALLSLHCRFDLIWFAECLHLGDGEGPGCPEVPHPGGRFRGVFTLVH